MITSILLELSYQAMFFAVGQNSSFQLRDFVKDLRLSPFCSKTTRTRRGVLNSDSLVLQGDMPNLSIPNLPDERKTTDSCCPISSCPLSNFACETKRAYLSIAACSPSRAPIFGRSPPKSLRVYQQIFFSLEAAHRRRDEVAVCFPTMASKLHIVLAWSLLALAKQLYVASDALLGTEPVSPTHRP